MNKFEYKHIRLDYKGRGITQEINLLDIDGERIRGWGGSQEVPTLPEMFEALGHLKNWKPHRQTEMPEIDREEFLEEIVDAFNYFFSLIILIGVDVEEFYDAFKKKDEIIRERVLNGY